MEPDTAPASTSPAWRSMVAALPGAPVAVIDTSGALLAPPEWLDTTTTPWSDSERLYTPIHDGDRPRVEAALERAVTEDGQATTVARLTDGRDWTLVSFHDARNIADVGGVVVTWAETLDDAIPADTAPQQPLPPPPEVDRPTPPTPDGPALALDDLPVAAAHLDSEGSFVTANRRWYQLLGLTLGEGADWLDGFDPDDLARLAEVAGQSTEVDTTARRDQPDGSIRWIRIRGLSRRGEDGGAVWLLDDVTDQVALVGTVAELEHQQTHEDGTTAAVLVVGVDGVGHIRNIHGETAADLVLQATDERLRAVLRPYDHVGRLAADEFAVVCTRMRGGDSALAVGRRVLAELEEPFEIGGEAFSLAPCVGVAVTDDPDQDPVALLEQATTARHAAAQSGLTLARADDHD